MCFFYEYGFGRFVGNDDIMYMIGCVDIFRKIVNGCVLSVLVSARLGFEDLEIYFCVMVRLKVRLLELDWYYIFVCCVFVSLAFVVAFVVF